jgi:hypothetical protein
LNSVKRNVYMFAIIAEKMILTFPGSMAACLDVLWLTTYSVRNRISKPQPEHVWKKVIWAMEI